jgi:hypothetical protein
MNFRESQSIRQGRGGDAAPRKTFLNVARLGQQGWGYPLIGHDTAAGQKLKHIFVRNSHGASKRTKGIVKTCESWGPAGVQFQVADESKSDQADSRS